MRVIRFWMFNAIGRQMYKEALPKVRSSTWRPYFNAVLPDKEKKKIIDGMKDMVKK